jgi:hypothetical protein
VRVSVCQEEASSSAARSALLEAQLAAEQKAAALNDVTAKNVHQGARVCLSVRLSVHPSIRLSVCMSGRPAARLSV